LRKGYALLCNWLDLFSFASRSERADHRKNHTLENTVRIGTISILPPFSSSTRENISNNNILVRFTSILLF
jgi:hypothetical protein